MSKVSIVPTLHPKHGLPLQERLSAAELNDIGYLVNCMSAGAQIIEEARDKLHDDERMLAQVKDRLNFLYHGVEPGVLVRKTMSGEVYKVHRVSGYGTPRPNEKPNLEGFKQKKDGTFGVRACTVWGNWELVK